MLISKHMINVPPNFDTPIEKLKWVMRCLRDTDNGCPWDLEQTNQTIAPYTIEEAYEVVDAIEHGTGDDLQEELGDLLFQVMFYTQISAEKKAFDFDDIATGIADKMIARHPHVFGDKKVQKAEEVYAIWEEQKSKEKQSNGALDNITQGLPALLRAQKIQKKAAKVGFEWPTPEQAYDKVTEEIQEFNNAKTPQDKEEEFGDLLLALVNWGGMQGINSEEALRKANNKFISRFEKMEHTCATKKVDFKDLPLNEMLILWDKAKQ